jgi:hypothetical protein
MGEERFDISQAEALTTAFEHESVDFLFIGKGAAIIMGYPSATLDVDLFLPKSPENGQKVVRALKKLGFKLTESQAAEIIRGKDFIQLNGPFDLDLIHAPDGLPEYEKVKARSVKIDNFPLVSLPDIIKSKEATHRQKDLMDLPMLRAFQRVYDQEQTLRNTQSLDQQQQQQQEREVTLKDERLGPNSSRIAQLDSAISQAEELRDEQVQQQYGDQLGVYVQEKAEQIDRLRSSLAAALAGEQTNLQALQQTPPGWTAGKKAHAQWEQQVARRKTRIVQIELRLDRVGEIEEEAGIYAETKIEELAERKLRVGQPELAQEWLKMPNAPKW